MTLATHVHAYGEVDPHETFHFCRGLLGATDAHPFTDRSYGDHHMIGNQRGIGLSALMSVDYRPGAPLRLADAGHEDYCEDDCDGQYHPKAAWLDVTLDTAYGYNGPNGEGCGDLHARLVAQLGRWFDERNVEWGWQNEFTGELHRGDDRYARLADLGRGGEGAAEWFANVVKPAILSQYPGAV